MYLTLFMVTKVFGATSQSPQCTQGCIDNQGNFSCIPGYHVNPDTSTIIDYCVKCSNFCQTCSSASICLTCIDLNAYLESAVCLCNAGYSSYNLLDTSMLNCTKCDDGCNECTFNPYICISCSDISMELVSNKCVCKSGFYEIAGEMGPQCVSCYQDCSTCTEADICKTCVDINSTPDLIQGCTCNNGFWKENTESGYVCNQCSPGCAACIESSLCLTCEDGYFNSSSLDLGGTCFVCNQHCKTCSTPDLCITCIATNAIPSLAAGCTCPVGYYLNGTLDFVNSCPKCSSECETCGDATTCQTCISNNAAPGVAGCECQSGFVGTHPLSSANSCFICNSECSTCNDPSKCLTCKSNNASPSPSSGCICNAGFYNTSQLTSVSSCISCYSECASCNQANLCTSCIEMNAIPDVTQGCKCNNGFYAIGALTSSNTCLACDSHCSTCIGSNTCLTCKSSNATPSPNKGCTCNFRYYEINLNTTNGCGKCHSDCATCSNANTCLTCIALNSSPSLVGCSCDQHFYKNNTGSCEPCLSICQTCINGTSCTTCIDANSFPSGSNCVCNTGYYLDLSVCSPCSRSCLTCIIPNECTSCSDINAEVPLCSCKKGYVFSINNICVVCDLSCSQCDDLGNCINCLDELATLSSKTCVCDIGYYKDVSGYCKTCHQDCKQCETDFVCLTCKLNNSSPAVIGCSCNRGFYLDQATQICKPCGLNCKECIDLENCISCQEGYYGPLCLECNSECKSCTGSSYFECSSCKVLILSNTCSTSCPIGFKPINGVCTYNNFQFPTIRFDFKGIGPIYLDSFNNISVQPLPLQTRRLSNSIPISTKERGIYLDGSCSLYLSTSSKLFNNDFSISIWSRPLSTAASLISKYDSSKQLKILSLSYQKSSTIGTLSINNSEFSYSSSKSFNLLQWNHFYFTVKYEAGTLANIWLNYKSIGVQNMDSAAFTDSETSFMIIGSDLNMIDSFNGFFYSFEVFADLHGIEKVASVDLCEFCNVCLVSGVCLSVCEIDEFYNGESESCEKCGDECGGSCVGISQCLECSDDGCEYCLDFEPGSCYKCLDGFELKNGKCDRCGDGKYFDEDLLVCNECPSLCLTCESSSKCKLCKENSSLFNSKCICDKGFIFKEICVQSYFNALLEISKENSIKLLFTEPLLNDLKKSDIIIEIDDKPVKFELKFIDKSTYKISINEDNIKSSSILNLNFLSKLVSKSYSILDTIR